MDLKNTLSTKALMAAFNVSHMTIHSWRAGSATRDPLPIIDTGSRSVLFKPAEVKRWAKNHKIQIIDAEALVPGNEIATRPGPRRATKSATHRKMPRGVTANGKRAARPH